MSAKPAARPAAHRSLPVAAPLAPSSAPSVQGVEILIKSGLFFPDGHTPSADEIAAVVRDMGALEIAPGIVVDAAYLRWHPTLDELVYMSPERPGSFTRLMRHTRAFTLGGDETNWMQDGSGSYAERFSIELGSLMTAQPCTVSLPINVSLALPQQAIASPEKYFIALATDHALLDIDNPTEVPVFASLVETCRLSDAALLADETIPADWSPFVSSQPPRLRWLQCR